MRPSTRCTRTSTPRAASPPCRIVGLGECLWAGGHAALWVLLAGPPASSCAAEPAASRKHVLHTAHTCLDARSSACVVCPGLREVSVDLSAARVRQACLFVCTRQAWCKCGACTACGGEHQVGEWGGRCRACGIDRGLQYRQGCAQRQASACCCSQTSRATGEGGCASSVHNWDPEHGRSERGACDR